MTASLGGKRTNYPEGDSRYIRGSREGIRCINFQAKPNILRHVSFQERGCVSCTSLSVRWNLRKVGITLSISSLGNALISPCSSLECPWRQSSRSTRPPRRQWHHATWPQYTILNENRNYQYRILFSSLLVPSHRVASISKTTNTGNWQKQTRDKGGVGAPGLWENRCTGGS